MKNSIHKSVWQNVLCVRHSFDGHTEETLSRKRPATEEARDEVAESPSVATPAAVAKLAANNIEATVWIKSC